MTRIDKKVAERIIDDLGILKILEPFGDARVVGSIALDVIVKPDIDIHVVVDGDIFEVINAVYKHFINNENIREVKIKDFRDRGGMLVGVDRFIVDDVVWSTDIWVTNDMETTGFADIEKLQKDMTQEHREIIVKIKEEYYANRGGTSGGISPKIYKSVVYDGVRSVEEFSQRYA